MHSVFDKVINITSDCGELFSLVCRSLDNAPNTAILNLSSFDTVGVAVGDQVACGRGRLRVGDRLTIALTAASAWDDVLPHYPAALETLRANLRSLRSQVGDLGMAGGVVARHGATNEFEAAVTALLGHHSACLMQALSHQDFARGGRHARSMLGLGPGLTPSGDDFLVGLFAVLNLPESPCHGWLGGGAAVIADAEHLTNSISFAALRKAADGRVRESIMALIAHLMYGDPESLVDPLNRVLAIGSTSGADIVSGIRSGFELNIAHGEMRSCQ